MEMSGGFREHEQTWPTYSKYLEYLASHCGGDFEWLSKYFLKGTGNVDSEATAETLFVHESENDQLVRLGDNYNALEQSLKPNTTRIVIYQNFSDGEPHTRILDRMSLLYDLSPHLIWRHLLEDDDADFKRPVIAQSEINWLELEFYKGKISGLVVQPHGFISPIGRLVGALQPED